MTNATCEKSNCQNIEGSFNARTLLISIAYTQSIIHRRRRQHCWNGLRLMQRDTDGVQHWFLFFLTVGLLQQHLLHVFLCRRQSNESMSAFQTLKERELGYSCQKHCTNRRLVPDISVVCVYYPHTLRPLCSPSLPNYALLWWMGSSVSGSYEYQLGLKHPLWKQKTIQRSKLCPDLCFTHGRVNVHG